jgi:predicted dehydrogenase
MSGRRVRAAIIGTGRIASRLEKDPLRAKPSTHAGWYAAHPRVDLVAGADTDQAALAEFSGDWAVPAAHCYGDYREMLWRERPDVVSVCAYAPERVEMCEAAIAAGARGLWIEKAVACSLDEARRLEAALAGQGVTAVVDQPRRGDPRYRAVRRVVAEERLGRLETVHAVFSGHFLHTGTHAWDVLRFWCGQWDGVTAWLESGRAGSADGRVLDTAGHLSGVEPGDSGPADGPVDRGGQAVVRFSSGTRAFVSGCRKRFFVFQFDLLFEGGRLQVGNDVWLAWAPAPSPRYTGFVELAPGPAGEWLTADEQPPRSMLDDLLHCLDTGDPPLMSVRHAVAALELGLAAFQSDATGHVEVLRGSVDPALRIVSR